MSIDGGLRTLFHKNLKQFHWQAIETGGVGMGVPDSNACAPPGIEFWVEFKTTDRWSVVLRPEQVGWLLRRSRAGGHTFIATRRAHSGGPRRGAATDELWLHGGHHAAALKAGGLKGAQPLAMWSGGPGAWPWDAVAALLTAPAPR